MPLYTEEQLSMILSAHAAGWLINGGVHDFGIDGFDGRYGGCINQIAFNEPLKVASIDMAPKAARWFDNHYSPDMPVSRLLHKLESF